MKNTPTFNSQPNEDDLLPEYDFDYSKAKPNRFVNKEEKTRTVKVMLDPDIAEVFSTSEAVNHALRSLLSALPKKQ